MGIYGSLLRASVAGMTAACALVSVTARAQEVQGAAAPTGAPG